MPLFGLRREPPPRSVPEGMAVLGAGHRLHTDLDRADAMELLSIMADEPRPGIPRLLPATFLWLGTDPAPRTVVSFGQDGGIVLAAFWTSRSGTDLALFPLNSGPDRAITPIVGWWKRMDDTLRSTGHVAAGRLGLCPPRLPRDLLFGTLSAAGVGMNVHNAELLAEEVRDLVLVRAHQFIAALDPEAAEQFVDDHRDATSETIVRDLARWDSGVVPYIQDLFHRVQAVLLERGADDELLASVWKSLDFCAWSDDPPR